MARKLIFSSLAMFSAIAVGAQQKSQSLLQVWIIPYTELPRVFSPWPIPDSATLWRSRFSPELACISALTKEMSKASFSSAQNTEAI